MSDDDQPAPGPDPAAAPGAPRDEVGSVGEEAAKLFGVLTDWAREQAPHDHGPHDHAGPHAHDGPTGPTGPTGEDCHWCPVCRTAHLVRRTSPEVKMHLAQAASSLVQAAAGLLATHTGEPRAAQVQKIDLDDDSDWDEDQ
ncbi:hypothetical protein GCM10027596_35070 [Nocardioides korecus]